MVVEKGASCGNSPKNALVEDFTERFVADDDYGRYLSEDAVFESPSGGFLNGGGAARASWLAVDAIDSLELLDGISHGKKGAVDFFLVLKDGSRLSGALFVEFASLKADRIRRVKLVGAFV